MNWLIALWAAVPVWLARWIPSLRPKSYRYHLVKEALPKNLNKRLLYVVEEDGYLEQAAMVCPCGCGATLHMNLLSDERPCWTVIHHPNGTASLKPSVWRKVGCKSHFWLRSGQVQWCK